MALLLSFTFAITQKNFVGVDIHFHLNIARVWARGENGAFSSFAMEINKSPYPPLFHWFLLPGIWLGMEDLYVRCLQTIFYPLAVFLSIWLISEKVSKKAGFICGLFLISSGAFYDRMLQAIPQSIDFILFPLLFYAYLEDNKRGFILLSTLLIFNHGVVAIAFLGGLFFSSLISKEVKPLLLIGLLASPVMIPILVYLPQTLTLMGGAINTGQEANFLRTPLLYSIKYLGSLVFAIPLLLISARKWIHISEISQLSILTILSLSIMLPFWPDRFLQYSTLPLCYLLASEINYKYVKYALPLILYNYSIFWLKLYGVL